MNENYYDINDSIENLILKFRKIAEKGWIKKETNNPGEYGLNFEELLGNNKNDLQIADYKGIELKTKSHGKYSQYITLFNLTPLGKEFFEINRLKTNYGYPDKQLKNCNILNGDVFCNSKNKIGAKFYFQLKVNKQENHINLLIFDKFNNLIDNYTFWPYDLIKERIYCKLKYLALITVETRLKAKEKYYKYTNIEIYQFKTFDDFINAIEKDYIKIQFKIGVFKSGKRTGQTHDRGTGFQINKENITSIYNKIYPTK